MIVLKNMKKLPKSCFECKFSDYKYNDIFMVGNYVCNLEHNYIMCDAHTQKSDWCPLEEVK